MNTNIIKWILENRELKISIALVLACVFWFRSCKENERLQTEISTRDANIIALKDSIRTEKLRNGAVQQVKASLVAEMSDLKKMNIELYEAVKEQRTQVFYMSKLTASINDKLKNFSGGGEHTYDPVTGKDMISWKFDTVSKEWNRKLQGFTSFKIVSDCKGYKIDHIGSTITDFSQNFKITTGLKESEKYPGNLEIFVSSTYPGMVFTDIQGSVVNPNDFKKYLPSEKPKNFTVGPYIGIGYDLLKKEPTVVPSINLGFGLQYKIFSF